MTDLFQATRKHDLPPLWDGEPVVWGRWRPPVAIFMCNRSARVEPAFCTACHSTANPALATGTVGRFRRLTAFRCPDCGHDTVADADTGEVWDLDPTDYQDEGSTAP